MQNQKTIITVTGYKGGVGKSTTAVHLGTFFAERFRTLLVAADPNRTAVSWSPPNRILSALNQCWKWAKTSEKQTTEPY